MNIVINTFSEFKSKGVFENSNILQQLYPGIFTSREIQCIFLLMFGKSSKEIANTMRLSTRTVDDHLIRIRAKLNAKTSREVMVKVSIDYKNNLLKKFSALQQTININSCESTHTTINFETE